MKQIHMDLLAVNGARHRLTLALEQLQMSAECFSFLGAPETCQLAREFGAEGMEFVSATVRSIIAFLENTRGDMDELLRMSGSERN